MEIPEYFFVSVILKFRNDIKCRIILGIILQRIETCKSGIALESLRNTI